MPEQSQEDGDRDGDRAHNVLEAVKTEIICLPIKEIPDAVATTIILRQAACQVSKQKEGFRIPRGKLQQPLRRVHRRRPVHTQHMVQLSKVYPRPVLPTEHPLRESSKSK